jgi:integrase
MASVFKRGGKGNRGGFWYVAWTDHNGIRSSKCTRTTDKATAERIGARLEDEAAKRREGLIDPQLEGFVREARRPMAELLAEYKAKLEAGGRTVKHVKYAVEFVKSVATFASFSTVGDMTTEGVNLYARHLLDEGRAARTIQAHLNAAKGFTRWLVECGKLPRDPLASVKKPNPNCDRRRRRRMLLNHEWPHLEAAAIGGPERNGMTGAERALLYRVAIQTGLRANELRSLTRASAVVDAPRPYIRVSAADTKNSKAAQQFIDRPLGEALRAHVQGKTPAAELFGLPHESTLARMLREDLEAARGEWLKAAKDDAEERTRREQSDFLTAENHEGQYLDFHSLRHTCGAWLAQSGAHPKTVQVVMRHSSITLTMDTYGHLLPGAEAEAADRLGAMVGASLLELNGTEKNILRMTGTDDAPVSAQRVAQQLGRESTLSDATACDEAENSAAKKKSPKPLVLGNLSDDVQDDALPFANSGGGTRTPDTRIMIPLL